MRIALLIFMPFISVVRPRWFADWRRRACAPGDACAADRVVRNQRIMFWLVALPVTLLPTLPLHAPLFY